MSSGAPPDGMVRGLTSQCRTENFDEYTKRQYNAKAPHITNPFGYDEQPHRFLDFDVFTKLRVLHQLTVWTFWNPDRIRDKMPETKEWEQTQWVSWLSRLCCKAESPLLTLPAY